MSKCLSDIEELLDFLNNYYVTLPAIHLTEDCREVDNWCEENFTGRWMFLNDTLYTGFEADAILFKLTWL